MLVNGYEVGQEPTREEFATYFKVEQFFERETVAQWLEGFEGEGRLTDSEFDELCHRWHKADFSAENSDFIGFEYDEIISERHSLEK